jgi:iron complex outermembrane receptor protein
MRLTSRPFDLPMCGEMRRVAAFAASLSLTVASVVSAQSAPVGPVVMPPVTVTAEKEPAEVQKLPLSVTAVSGDVIDRTGATTPSEASVYAPNTLFNEFTARKLSNVTFRGIGSSPANPGITTVIDGVPQLNTHSSSVTLLDIEQIEFVRGPQSALFGRNTLGGLINITSRRPPLSGWDGRVVVPLANTGGRGVQGAFAGPLKAGTLALGVAFDYNERDGFSENLMTGNDLDARAGFSGKAQIVWMPSNVWETRVIVSGERARDGDYALNDLAAVRATPFSVARDFEGRTDRDIVSTILQTRRQGGRVTFTTATGLVRWETRDLTDLDYTPLPLATRDNLEDAVQFTHETRLASAPTAPVRLSDMLTLRWQTGLFLFTQHYQQDAVNTYSPGLISEFITFPLQQHTPQSTLDDVGIGLFGQATLTFRERLDLALGARFDHESKDGTMRSFFAPAVPGLPAVETTAERGFSNVSPRLGVAYHVTPARTVYASVAQGFKAGGFNPASPPTTEVYQDERAWHAEGGWKSSWANGRVTANAAGFYVDWQDMQLNLPNPFVPGQFYIGNVGAATSRGAEFEVTARPVARFAVFGAVGFTRARFKAGSRSEGLDVGGMRVPNTPDRTATIGAEVAGSMGGRLSFTGRAETVFYGAFAYDTANTERQDDFALTNLRAIIRRDRVVIEAWMKNAFNTFYVPVAFSYAAFAPSGFIGEPGRPRTFGITAGVGF